MSVFNCAVTYKKSKYSKQAVKNQLVAHKFIDDKFNILDLNKFRQANTELSNDASEKLGKKVRLFAEENGGKKALPYESVFKELDTIKINTTNKEIAFDIKQISEKVFLINITSPEQFKQYAAQNKDKLLILESTPDMTTISVPGIGPIEGLALDNIMTISTIGATKQDIKNSFEDLDIELRADGTFDVVFVNQDYGSSLKNSDLESYNVLNSLLKNNFNFNNTNANSIEVAENNQAQVDYQLSINFSEVADVMNNLTCK